eukprot:2560833-Amphidinium_carterae.1
MAHGGPAADPQVSADLSTVSWLPADGGWTCNGQWFSWDEATLRAKWDSAQVLCAEVARTRPDFDFEGLALGLSTSAYRQLKLDGQ